MPKKKIKDPINISNTRSTCIGGVSYANKDIFNIRSNKIGWSKPSMLIDIGFKICLIKRKGPEVQ